MKVNSIVQPSGILYICNVELCTVFQEPPITRMPWNTRAQNNEILYCFIVKRVKNEIKKKHGDETTRLPCRNFKNTLYRRYHEDLTTHDHP